MKKIFQILLIVAMILLPTTIYASDEEAIEVHYFYDRFCTNCAEVTTFLEENVLTDNQVVLKKYDVFLEENQDLFYKISDTFDLPRSYPLIIVGGTALQGTVEIESNLVELIAYYKQQTSYTDVVKKVISGDEVDEGDRIDNPLHIVHLPVIGDIDRTSFSLLLGAVVIGLVDGFNPCAMWVLVFLITMLIHLKNRKRIWLLGSTFIFVSGLIYFLLMMSWLQIAVSVMQKQVFQFIIGGIAVGFAALSFRHFWRMRQKEIGCEVTNDKQRSKLMIRIRQVVQKTNLWLALLGVIGIALTVNLIELACSAGLPVIYTSMLAYHQVGQFKSGLYVLVYVFFFMLDDLIIFAIAMVTFRVTGISSRYQKYSSLIGGLIMLFIGLALLFFPSWLF